MTSTRTAVSCWKPELAMRWGWVILRMNLAYAVLVGVAYLIARSWLFRAFSDDPAVIAAAVAIFPCWLWKAIPKSQIGR